MPNSSPVKLTCALLSPFATHFTLPLSDHVHRFDAFNFRQLLAIEP
jgi:hypothetical protein